MVRFSAIRRNPDKTYNAVPITEVIKATVKVDGEITPGVDYKIHGNFATIYLTEYPYLGATGVEYSVTIPTLTEHKVVQGETVPSINLGEFIVDYETGIVYMNASYANQDFSITYQGVGAVVDWTKLTSVVTSNAAEVGRGITQWNFHISDHKASLESHDEGAIEIYLPEPSFAPDFNDTTLSFGALTDRFIGGESASDTGYKITPVFAAGSLQKTTKEELIVYTEEFNINNTTDIIEIILYDIDNNILGQSSTTVDSNKTTGSSQGIVLTISAFGNVSGKYKAKITATVDFTDTQYDSFSSGGYVKAEIKFNTSPIQSSKTVELLLDRYTTAVSNINSVSLINTATQYLSGINYYTQAQVSCVLDNINYVSSNTWSNNIIDITTNITNNKTITFADLIGASQEIKTTGASANEQLTVLQNTTLFNQPFTVTAETYTWSDITTITVQNYTNIMLNTLTNSGVNLTDDTHEGFINESYRLTSSLTPWNSNQLIDLYDDNHGCIVTPGELKVRPNLTLNSVEPNTVNISYSADTFGTYLRQFKDTGVSHSSGKFTFTGSNLSEASNLTIEISLDGTNWYNCLSNFMGGTLNDGDGCRINSSTHNLDAMTKEIEFTLSDKFTSSSSDWGLYFRLHINDINIVFNSISLTFG